jgi:hypothetical protein
LTHSATSTAGQTIAIRFTTQASETLTSVNCSLEVY